MKNELQAASHGFRVAVSQNKDESRFGFQTRILSEDVEIVVMTIRQPICRKEGLRRWLNNHHSIDRANNIFLRGADKWSSNYHNTR